MSTRQPFLPVRAPSRASSNGSAAPDKADFATSSNDTKDAEDKDPQPTNVSPTSAAPTPGISNIANGINKPLNLAGFAKRRNKPEQQVFSAFAAKPRRSFESAGRPGETDRVQQLTPRRPFSPFFPHPQEILPSHARAPRRSSPPGMQNTVSVDDLSSNQAHILTSRASSAGLVHTNNATPQSYSSSAAFKVSARPSLEKIHEAAEEEELIGAQGVVRAHGSAQFDTQPTGHEGILSRRSAKRLERPEPDVEDDFDYQPALKRYKADGRAEQRDIEDPEYSRSSPMYRQASEEPVRAARNMQPDFPDFEGQRFPAANLPPAPEESALRKLLGQDLDKFVNEHLEAYNDARKKWSECSVEEWQAGADELTAKFEKLLEFVKNHMTTKMALYTKLHANITNHHAVLSERAKMLKEAQDNLVRGGGGVIAASKIGPKRVEETPQAQTQKIEEAPPTVQEGEASGLEKNE